MDKHALSTTNDKKNLSKITNDSPFDNIDLLELTTPQKNIWNMEQYYNGTSINNLCGTVLFHEKINEKKLQMAIDITVRICDGFNLQFINNNNTVNQYFDRNIANNYYTKIYNLSNQGELARLENESSHTVLSDNNLFDIKVFKFNNGEGGLIYSVHHLLSDSWALGIAYNTIIAIYYDLLHNDDIKYTSHMNYNSAQMRAFIEHEKEKLNLSSYSEFIRKEKDYSNTNAFKNDKVYWNDKFEIIPEVPEISQHKHSNADSNSCEASRKEFKLSSSTVQLINQFCKDNKVSVFNFLIAVYSIYISSITNLDDFVIGTPILNRKNFVEKNTLGMFVSTIPLRINIVSGLCFSEFVKKVSADTFSSLRHQHYPYDYLLRDLRAKHENVPNLYNVVLSYQITKNVTDKFSCETYWNFNGNSADDLQVHIVNYNDADELSILYDFKHVKYSADDIKDIHNRIASIIEQVLENSDIKLCDIDILTNDEINSIIYDFNNTLIDYPKDKTIFELFEEQVEKTPNNVALVFENQKLTYKQLNEKANILARILRANGIGRNNLVGIMCSRSLEIIVSILAVLKAGGAYVPIDPTYPKDRIKYMLDSSHAKLLLTQEKLQALVDFKNKIFIDLSNDEIYSSKDTGNLSNINSSIDLAYVIFTSGSTGRPKGVMLQHNNVVNFICDISKRLDISSKDTVVSITTFSFDMFVLESLVPLANGMKMVIANEDEQNNIDLFNKLCIKNNVNVFNTSPSRMQVLTSVPEYLDYIKNATRIFIGGEPFPLTFLESLKKITNARIFNLYGPTETAVYSSVQELTCSNEITVGKPISNTQIYILNKNLKAVPYGISGDLYIAGDGVCKGYLNNSKLTKECFIPNPYFPNRVMYKTGDIGLINNDSSLVCLGRSNSQVKIRGLRVELGEIEYHLSKYPSINQVVVVKKEDSSGTEALCAYFTASRVIDFDDIKIYLGKFLPQYMVPQYFTQMDMLPSTPNGKINRRDLPNPVISSTSKKIITPRNDVDEQLLVLFRKILNVPSVSINESFFDLGGDSLSAINLSAQIQSIFNVQLFVKDILKHSTIMELSDIISEKNNSLNINNTGTDDDNYNNCIITPAKEAEFYEASSAQKRMFFASQAARNSTLYNIPGSVIFDKHIDEKKLEKCINAVMERHEPLRTYFDLMSDNVVQKILPKVNFKLGLLRDADFNDLDKLFREFVRPFDLSKAPLFRAKYVTFTNGKSCLFLDVHHIICDGTSISIFANEICRLYNGESLPNLDITYKDFSEYDNKRLKDGLLNNAEDYWIHQFNGELPALNMPTSYPRPALQSFEGKKLYYSIDTETVCRIEKLAKKLGVTPYMLLLSAYYVLLYKYTSQDDIIVGSPLASRDIASTQNLIGMFVNTLALRKHLDSSSYFGDFVLSVKEQLLDAYKYQTYPFDELINKLNIQRDASRSPLFDVMFIYQNYGLKDFDFNGINSKFYVPDTQTSKFDITLEITHHNKNTMNFSFEYCIKLFNQKFIRNFANHYLNIINTILDNENIKISDICMLSMEEKNKIMYDFNNTRQDYPKHVTIYSLFEDQVNKTPDKIALVFSNEKYTYKELYNKVNRLASYIKRHSIYKEICKDAIKPIGIMMNRRSEVLVSMLAILKLGCAYVPIDPSYPEDRISYIIDNSNIKLILTEQAFATKFADSNIETTDDVESLFNVTSILVDDSKIYKSIEDFEDLANPTDIAYIIYTSGSTGKPKGVMIRQNNVVNFIYSMNDLFNFKNKIIVSITTICFDIFVLESLVPICTGSKIILANNEEQNNPILLNDLCNKNNVNMIQTTPSKFSFLISDENNLKYVKNMKHIVLGGEALPLNLLNKIKSLTSSRIHNMYGPTETTVWSTTKELTNEKQVTIGAPISNTQVYVLDKDLNMVAQNVPGKLYIGGDGVSAGYLGRPELTAEKFIEYNGSIIYDTGDLAKFNSEGELEFLGRNDFQVKIRGLRIELGEIEKQIASYNNIEDAVVVVKNINERQVVCGYFVASGRVQISLLRNWLSRKLPNYMVPTYLTQIEKFEHTPNGKIDRKKLPDPEITKKEIVHPKTNLESKIYKILKSILSIDEISIKDNFFEIGGDSLSALKLQLELMKLNIKIDYGDIFKYNTIEELSLFIENNHDSEDIPIYRSRDFKHINRFLRKSYNKQNFQLQQNELKNILLVGATGFLGVHVLAELLKDDNIKIYCLIREDPSTSVENKLINKFKYYFGSDLKSLFGKRVFVVAGDITKPHFGLSWEKYSALSMQVYSVINCAANVKHYGDYKDFEKVNLTGVKNIIEFCEEFGKTFFHVSTISVGGYVLTDLHTRFTPLKKVYFSEKDLFINQPLKNVYIRSKFEAEKFMLEELSNKKLRGIILRVGNITNRFFDGKFQENSEENAFINRLKAFLYLKMIPESLLSEYLEFSPVDYIAQSIIQSVRFYTKPMSILHLYNSKHITVSNLINYLNELGIKIKVVDDETFKNTLNNVLFNSSNFDKVSILLNDMDQNNDLLYKTNLNINNELTLKFLSSTGFDWPEIDKDYIKKILDNL